MKVSEIVYSVMDLSKTSSSDDSWVTEEFVLFLCKKYRAFLIKKEQEKNRGAEDVASVFEQQEICLDLEKKAAIDGEPCTGGYYLRSTKSIPKLLDGYQPKVYPIDYFQGTNIAYVSNDRMRYVGSNKYLQNIIYSSIAPDLHLYLSSSNPQFYYLKKIRMTGIFEDFEDVLGLQCDDNNAGGESTSCDILDMDFPIREHLVPPLIELVVKEITGSFLYKADEINNAKDDMVDINRKA